MAKSSFRARVVSRDDRELIVELVETDIGASVAKVRSLLFAFALIQEAPGAPVGESDLDDDSTERIHAERIAGDIELFERIALHEGPPKRAEFRIRVRDRAMIAHMPSELRWSSQLEDLFVR